MSAVDGYAESGHEVAMGEAVVESVLFAVAEPSDEVGLADMDELSVVASVGLHGSVAFGLKDAGYRPRTNIL